MVTSERPKREDECSIPQSPAHWAVACLMGKVMRRSTSCRQRGRYGDDLYQLVVGTSERRSMGRRVSENPPQTARLDHNSNSMISLFLTGKADNMILL